MHLYKLRFKDKGTVTANAIAVPFAFSSFNLLFQFIKLRRGEKLAKRDIQTVTNHLDCKQLRVIRTLASTRPIPFRVCLAVFELTASDYIFPSSPQ